MQRFSEKCRKGLRKFFLILGVAAVSLVFQACYGMPMEDWEDDLPEDNSEESLSEENNV